VYHLLTLISCFKKPLFLHYLIINNYFTVSEAVVVLGEGTKVNTSIVTVNTQS
jgi:hypothetical protein